MCSKEEVESSILSKIDVLTCLVWEGRISCIIIVCKNNSTISVPVTLPLNGPCTVRRQCNGSSHCVVFIAANSLLGERIFGPAIGSHIDRGGASEIPIEVFCGYHYSLYRKYCHNLSSTTICRNRDDFGCISARDRNFSSIAKAVARGCSKLERCNTVNVFSCTVACHIIPAYFCGEHGGAECSGGGNKLGNFQIQFCLIHQLCAVNLDVFNITAVIDLGRFNEIT